MGFETLIGIAAAVIAAIAGAFGLGHIRGSSKAEAKADQQRTEDNAAAMVAAAERRVETTKEASNVQQTVNHMPGDDVDRELRKVAFEANRFKVNEAAQSASNNEETAFNGGLAFCGFPGAISHDGANPADGDKATAEPISSIASATGIATKTRLTDEMQELVVKAVRESDLFTSIQTAIDAQAASAVALQQAVNDVVGDAIRNALKPGGMIWTSFQSCRH